MITFFFFFEEHRVTNTRTRLLVLVSPPHQVRTAADTAKRRRQPRAPSLLDSSGFKGLVVRGVCCSRARCCALCFVDDDGSDLLLR